MTGKIERFRVDVSADLDELIKGLSYVRDAARRSGGRVLEVVCSDLLEELLIKVVRPETEEERHDRECNQRIEAEHKRAHELRLLAELKAKYPGA